MSPQQDEPFTILGPLFRYDLIRTSRQGRVIYLRVIYAACLCAILGFWYLSIATEAALLDPARKGFFDPGYLPAAQAAQLAQGFFGWLVATQFVVLYLFTPLLTAGIVTEEKERQTLTFLLTTHLSDREIICGKLGARLAQIFLLSLTAVPFLGLLQLLGGVDFLLFLVSFLGMALFMVTLASLAAYHSATSTRTSEAALKTWWWSGVYLLLSPCVPVLNLGHPFLVWAEWYNYLASGILPWTVRAVGITGPEGILVPYLAFHVGLTGLFCTRALRALRPQAFKARVPASLSASRLPPRSRTIPPKGRSRLLARFIPYEALLDRWPLYWKEFVYGRNLLSDRHTLLLFYFGLGGFFFGSIFAPVRIVAMMLGLTTCFWVGAVALRGARAFSAEREAQTLDGLLGLPQPYANLVFAKAAGAVVRPSPGALSVLLIPCLSVLGIGLNVFALPLLALLAIAFGAFGAALGVLVSMFQTNSLRAAIWTVSIFVFVQVLAEFMDCSIMEAIMSATFGYGTASDHADLRYEDWDSGPPLVIFLAEKYVHGLLFVAGYGLATAGLLCASIWRLNAEAGPRPQRELAL